MHQMIRECSLKFALNSHPPKFQAKPIDNMSTSRSSKIEQLFKSLRKHYKTLPTAPERTVIEHLVYACIVEETGYEQADEALAKLLQAYVDFNEIRVTTAVELAELFGVGDMGITCAQRLKRILQSVYETRYSFDIEDLKKGNLAKSVEYFSGLKGMTPFVCSYISQNALGGHSIPIGTAEMNVALVIDLVTDAEAKKGSIPGLERAIPKSKGVEFAQLFHQLALDFVKSWKNPTVTNVFKDLKVTYKPAPPPPKEPPKVIEPPAKTAEPVAKVAKAPAKETAAPPAAKVVTKDAKTPKDAKVASTKDAKPAKEPAAKEIASKAPVKPSKEQVKPAAKPEKPSKPIPKPVSTSKKEPAPAPKTTKKAAPPPAKPTKEVKNAKPSKPPTKAKSAPLASKPKPPTAKKPSPPASNKKPPTKASKTTQALAKKKPR